MSEQLLQCFHRGCGQKFRPEENKEDSCCHHPGMPFFHDAYKGWSCCNKKSTDFTEFLNIKGCTLSPHSNDVPPEPEQPKVSNDEVIEVKPIVSKCLPRPPFESPLTVMKPEVALALQHAAKVTAETIKSDPNEILIGVPCKNNGCKVRYAGPESNSTPCIHHPGCPIFHEGMKYWTCCKKKTSDFEVFLAQVGCETGVHVWRKEGSEYNKTCRWDYHQTSLFVTVTIYAKDYDCEQSVIKLNPVRLYANLVFPHDGAVFSLDLELKGVINVEQSKIRMFGTKVEIMLKKAELGTWSNLDIPRKIAEIEDSDEETEDQGITSKVDAIDLGDL